MDEHQTKASSSPDAEGDWFLSWSGTKEGPYMLERAKVALTLKGKGHYWRPGMYQWELTDTCELLAVPTDLPASPDPENGWFLSWSGSQEGPYTLKRAKAVIALKGKGHYWRPGMSQWELTDACKLLAVPTTPAEGSMRTLLHWIVPILVAVAMFQFLSINGGIEGLLSKVQGLLSGANHPSRIGAHENRPTQAQVIAESTVTGFNSVVAHGRNWLCRGKDREIFFSRYDTNGFTTFRSIEPNRDNFPSSAQLSADERFQYWAVRFDQVSTTQDTTVFSIKGIGSTLPEGVEIFSRSIGDTDPYRFDINGNALTVTSQRDVRFDCFMVAEEKGDARFEALSQAVERAVHEHSIRQRILATTLGRSCIITRGDGYCRSFKRIICEAALRGESASSPYANVEAEVLAVTARTNGCFDDRLNPGPGVLAFEPTSDSSHHEWMQREWQVLAGHATDSPTPPDPMTISEEGGGVSPISKVDTSRASQEAQSDPEPISAPPSSFDSLDSAASRASGTSQSRAPGQLPTKYLFDLLKEPAFVGAWNSLLAGESNVPRWLTAYSTTFDGPAGPAQPVTISNRQYLASRVLKKGVEEFSVLFVADGTRAWGFLRPYNGAERFFGEPDDEQRRALRETLGH